ALALLSIKLALVPRISRLAAIATAVIRLTIQYSLFRQVFAGRGRVGGFDWPELRTYLLLVFLLEGLSPVQQELRMYANVRTGQVAVDLARPVDYFWSHLALSIGMVIGELSLRLLVLVPLAPAMGPLVLPPSLCSSLSFAAGVGLAFLTRLLLGYIIA